MDLPELDNNAEVTRAPRTTTVLVFLAAFSIILSWLSIYATTHLLVSVDLISGFSRDTDPRPRWMLQAFLGLFAVFGLIGLAFRWSSSRQLRRIDEMADAEEPPRE